MNQAIYDKLVAVAAARKLVSYTEVGAAADLDVSNSAQLHQLVKHLDEIALQEVKAGRPLLPAVVIRADTQMPSEGLFTFAKANRLMRGSDKMGFFANELTRIYATWAPKT